MSIYEIEEEIKFVQKISNEKIVLREITNRCKHPNSIKNVPKVNGAGRKGLAKAKSSLSENRK